MQLEKVAKDKTYPLSHSNVFSGVLPHVAELRAFLISIKCAQESSPGFYLARIPIQTRCPIIMTHFKDDIAPRSSVQHCLRPAGDVRRKGCISSRFLLRVKLTRVAHLFEGREEI